MSKKSSLALTALVLTFTASAPAQESGSTQAPLSEGSRQGIEQIIHQYLLQHPEVVRESVRLGEERERAEQKERTRKAVLAHLNDIQQDPSSPVVGKAGGNGGGVFRLSLRILQADRERRQEIAGRPS